jgi:hypothetical protein
MSLSGIHRKIDRSSLYLLGLNLMQKQHGTMTLTLAGNLDRIEIARRQVAGYIFPGNACVAEVENKAQLVDIGFGQVLDSSLFHQANPLFLDTPIHDCLDSLNFLA